MGSRCLENCRGGMRNVSGRREIRSQSMEWVGGSALPPLGPGGRARRLEFAFHSTSSAALFSLNESPLLPPLFSYRSLSHSLGFRNRGKLFFPRGTCLRTYVHLSPCFRLPFTPDFSLR